jgi:putative spermidine/putrescine transport system ATP-binding protein
LTNRIDGTAAGGVVNVLGTNVPLLDGSVQAGPVKALVRPENVRLAPAPEGPARVVAVSFLGSLCRAQVTLPDGTLVVAQMSAADARGLYPGATVSVGVVPAPVFAVAE